MIKYKFGNIECKISFNDFLSISYNNIKRYKSDFNNFAELYELIDKNLYNIYHILFDGYEYFLEKGILHNLYGPALIKHNDDKSSMFQGTSLWFYIDGKLVHSDTHIMIERGCKKLEDFQNEKIFHYEEITNKKSGRDENCIFQRRQEGIDYKIHFINLKNRIKKDQRKKKLKLINDYK